MVVNLLMALTSTPRPLFFLFVFLLFVDTHLVIHIMTF